MNLIVAAAILITTPVILVWPHVGILVWFWIGFMNPHRLAWGSVFEMPFAMVVGIATLAAWFLSREKKWFPLTSVTVLLALLSVWITWTTFYALVPIVAWLDWERSIKILAMTFVTMAIMASRERIHALVWVTVVSLGFYAVKGGVFTILGGGQYHVFGPRGSFISDNNQLAMALLMTLPFMRYLQLHSSVKPVRLGLIAAMVLTLISVVGSQSRGAFLALLAVGVAFVLKSRYRLQIGAFALCIALVGVWFVPEHWVERMESIQNYEQDQSAMGRIQAWKFGYEIAKRYPLTGGGFNVSINEQLYLSIVPESTRARSFHSVYFEVLGEHGFIGLTIFLLLGYFTWRTFGTVRKQAMEREELQWASDLAAMGQVSLIAYFSAGAFLNLAFFDLYYAVVALAVLTQAVVRKELGNEKRVFPLRQPLVASQTVSPSNAPSTAEAPTRTIR
jgi:probable O-glycosylation ligase (exosortase A-associated)